MRPLSFQSSCLDRTNCDIFAMADANPLPSSHCFADCSCSNRLWKDKDLSFERTIRHLAMLEILSESQAPSATSRGLSDMERISRESFSHFGRNREIGPLASKFLHSERSVW